MPVPFQQIPSNLRVPMFYAEVDPSRANTNEQTYRSLLVGQLLPTGSLNYTTSLATSATTATSSAVLHFASGPPAGIVPGMVVSDVTAPTGITAGTTVLSVDTTAHTVTMSANAAGPGVGSGDTIQFATPYTPTPKLITSKAQCDALCGVGSLMSNMVDAYRQNDTFGELRILALPDDSASTAASGTIAFAGQATAQGTLSLYVAGVLISTVITTTMTAAQIATAVAAAINLVSDLPVTATASSATVTVTARNKGAAGNDIDLRLNYRGVLGGEATPSGLTVTFSNLTGANSGAATLSGGATNPSTALTTALNTLPDDNYDFIGQPYSDTTSLDAFKTFLNDVSGRWAWSRQLYGHAVTALRNTVANLQTAGLARNDQHHSIMGCYDSPTTPARWAASLAGAVARSTRATTGIGRPLQTVPLIGVLAPPRAARFILTDRNTLLWSGISTFMVGQDGTVAIENLITTYQSNSFGQPDDSYLEIETMYLLSYILRFLKTRVTTKFPRMKLASDGTRVPANSGIVTPSDIKADQIAAFFDLEALGVVQDDSDFIDEIVVERDLTNPNRVNVLWPGTLINQLRIFALLAQFRLLPDSTQQQL
jgi:phage tail sheath gpL-like